MTVEDRIRALLDARHIGYRVVDHAPVSSAEDAAMLRGTPLGIGGKAIVMKLERIGFAALAVRADRRVDGKALRRALGIQRYRFATAQELAALTGLVPGEVPPFGRPVLELPLYVDTALASGEEIAFTVGRRDRSFVLATADWLAAASPDAIVEISE